MSKPPDQDPPNSEIVELRLFLINRQGYTPGQAGQAIGQTAGKTRRQIGQNIANWQKSNQAQGARP